VSRSNEEIFREMLAAFDRRDRDTWLANCHEDYESTPSAMFPEAHVIHGREAVWDFYLEVAEQFESVDFAPEAEIAEAGADKLLVHQSTLVRGRASGAEVVLDYWIVITFRDGRVARDEWFADRRAALEATGG
jgi:ketosteroid isomerase-like protein